MANLARELRRIRKKAKDPGYRELAEAARFSRETLAAAARGEQCPSWEVAKAFAGACDPTGAETRKIRPLWEKASKESRKAGRRRAPAAPSAQPARTAAPRAAESMPRPDPGGSPADYVYQLRALRAWAGIPHSPSRYMGGIPLYYLPPSTLHDALSPRRTTLPTLRTVKLILSAFLEDDNEAAEEWISAWRAISLREFTRANPRTVHPETGAAPGLRIVSDQ